MSCIHHLKFSYSRTENRQVKSVVMMYLLNFVCIHVSYLSNVSSLVISTNIIINDAFMFPFYCLLNLM
jgi:hypothetical protein